MPNLRHLYALVLITAVFCLPVSAQTAGSSSAPTSSSDRLFLSFIEDATVIENQWWEARLEVSDWDTVDVTALTGVVAFQPWQSWELGARVGFGDSDISGGSGVDGSGATDLNAWGKYYFGGSDNTEFAVGSVVTVPTGDDSAGLGFDAFGISAFGTIRHRLERLVLSFHGGLRFNDDGRFVNNDLKGETSALLGAGVIFPLADQVTIVGEFDYESGRFEGRDDDLTLLGGINWRMLNRGMLRGALGVGLADGAPDWQLIVGYAASL